MKTRRVIYSRTVNRARIFSGTPSDLTVLKIGPFDFTSVWAASRVAVVSRDYGDPR